MCVLCCCPDVQSGVGRSWLVDLGLRGLQVAVSRMGNEDTFIEVEPEGRNWPSLIWRRRFSRACISWCPSDVAGCIAHGDDLLRFLLVGVSTSDIAEAGCRTRSVICWLLVRFIVLALPYICDVKAIAQNGTSPGAIASGTDGGKTAWRRRCSRRSSSALR